MTGTTRSLLTGCLVVLLGGCASMDRGQTMGAIRNAVNEGVTQPETAPPPEVSNALLPDVHVALPGASQAAAEQRFDVRVRNAPANDFFMSLVEGTPYNMIVSPGVSGRVTLTLKNVTVPEVMEAVRNTYGYEFERDGQVYQVYPNTIQTRIFHVNYLDMKRTGNSQMTASPGEVTQVGTTGGTNGNERTTRQVNSGSKVQTDSEADFWSQLRADLTVIVGQGEGRQVVVNPMAGLVSVRARPSELRQVAKYIQAATNAAQRQVILEARIVEVTLSDSHQTGINWAAIGNSHGELAVFGPRTNQSGTIASTGMATMGGGSITNIANNGLQTSINQSLTFGLFGRDFATFIDLLKTQGDVQVLSSPRVSTVNNQQAVIKVGSDEFFVTNVNTNTVTGTATSQSVNVELTPFFSGVSLDVTPQISADGDVILHIHPAVSEVAEQTKSVNTSLGSLVLPLAASTIRESDSVIKAGNGQIVVIGGLMQNSVRKEKEKIPLLGDIPVLGTLFSHTGETVRKTELVILLKPTYVQGTQQWSNELRRSSRILNTMDRLGDNGSFGSANTP